MGSVPKGIKTVLPSSPLKKHIEVYRLDNKRESTSIGERSIPEGDESTNDRIQKNSVWNRAKKSKTLKIENHY
ncbi:MAG: hypothetical protein WC758_00100 [Candidatus Woesearchaeota archaeon]|jgi:hypothetical protein